ncbi:IPT/TIG domain-containing protein [Wenzhouxiangella sp. EGI_FJ10409]|uniref:IPT/TIG domain-containing protein n=1 Tax=Wenzhouxiangella sp. EGI_FJ10409 TaxID=3243767 RepID=UPI0035DD4918
MYRKFILAGLACAGLALAAPIAAQKSAETTLGGATGTITDGAASFEFTGTTDAAGFNVNFTAGGDDQAFSYGFSYRLDGETQESQLQGPSTSDFTGDTATLSWTDFNGTGLDATMQLVISEPAAGEAILTTTLSVDNPGGTDRTLDLFIYTDFDVNASAAGDSATLIASPDHISITETDTVEHRAGGADAYQVAVWPNIRNLLSDTAADDLDNSGLPFGPDDFTGAMQWQALDLFAGGSTTVETISSINVTAPAPADPVIIGGTPPPTVDSIAPSSGPEAGGTAVTITGSDFQSGATVDIGGSACTGVTFIDATELDCTTPAGTGTADVVVTNPDTQSDTLAGGFEYVAVPPPSIASITPASGPEAGGTAVTITGSDFQSGATVDIGGSACAGVTFIDATELDCTTPAGTGTADVVVTNPDTQSDTLAGGFEYVAVPPPSIASVTPNSGTEAGGTDITITGSGFQSGATVTIGGAACAGIVVVDDTTITCTTPPGAEGPVDVVVENPDAQISRLQGGFTYTGVPAETLSVPVDTPWALLLLVFMCLSGGLLVLRLRS